MYTINDLLKINGHCLTKDKKYIIKPDGDSGFSYWHEIIEIIGEKIITSSQLGHAGYDYVFYDKSDSLLEMNDAVNVLNKILTR